MAGTGRALAESVAAGLGVCLLSVGAVTVAAPGPSGAGSSDPGVAPAETPAAPLGTAPRLSTVPPVPGLAAPMHSPADTPGARGLLTFRGNRTRTYYGEGPVPSSPRVLWRFPEAPMCAMSDDGTGASRWCGTGWTGQPAVVERDGGTWVVFGAYDRAIHFLDAATGGRVLPDLPTGDIVKGSVTIDPDGYPLVYSGSRDGNLRVIAVDGPVPIELWRLPATAVSPTLWNDDWDGSPLVVDDYLIEGGENSQWHVVKLNRALTPEGQVSVRPELVFNAPGWDEQLLEDLGDTQVSIESSVAVWRDTVYFANSGGLVQGWDIGGLDEDRPPVPVFRFWTGDDTDATVVVDDEGMLYVAAEWERHTPRAAEVGQVLKLDPRRPDPLVWSLADQDEDVAGVWATPALHRDLVIVATNGGRILGIDRFTGDVRWTKYLPGPTWQSPVVVDDVLVQGDCAGVLHGYDVSRTAVEPAELWSVPIGGCIESTPAVWQGRIYVGTREGYLVALGDR